MAEQKQLDKPIVHGLEEKKDLPYEKIVIAKRVKGRWMISLSTLIDQIVTPRDVHNITKAIAVERRKMEHSYRQKLRKQARLQEQKV